MYFTDGKAGLCCLFVSMSTVSLYSCRDQGFRFEASHGLRKDADVTSLGFHGIKARNVSVNKIAYRLRDSMEH